MRIDLENLDDLAQGCAVLGTGGGGDVEPAVAQVAAAVAAHGAVEVVDLDDLSDDVLVMPIAGWGAPTVAIEKLGSGREAELLRHADECGNKVVVAEDHYAGAIASLVARTVGKVTSLCVREIPRSGTSAELLALMKIDHTAIARVAVAMIE